MNDEGEIADGYTKQSTYLYTQLAHDIEVLLKVEAKVGALHKIVPEFTREICYNLFMALCQIILKEEECSKK